MKSMSTLVEAFEKAGSLQAPLKQRLEALAGWHRELNPALAGAYDRMIDRLASVRSGADAPSIGQPMPPFVLPDQNGQLVSMDELRVQGPVVVSFNRGHWCTYCKMELFSLAQRHTEFEQLGARTVAITPDRQAFANRIRETADFPFTVLTDIDGGYALNLGLVVWVGDEVRSLYQSHRIELNEFQGNESWLVPIPATFVVGRDGLIKARHVDPDFRQRMDVEEILEALRDVAG